MSKLSLGPKNLPVSHVSAEMGVQAKAWRYEEKGGILVVTEIRDVEGKLLGTAQVMVRNSVIKAYQRRLNK